MLFSLEALAKLPGMLRARRIIGWLLAAAVACFAAVLLAVNLYVQSQGTQERIQQELSQRLDLPLRIQRISVTPWGGLTLSGLTISQTNPAAAPPFLAANSLRLHVRFRSIFRGPLVIKEVALIKPQVNWSQNESGKWRVPSQPSDQHVVRRPSSPAPPAPSLPPAPPAVRAPSRGLEIPEPEIKRVKMTDGSFHFLDRANHNVALFDGVEFSSAVREASSLRGETRVAKIALRDRVFLENLQADLRYDPDMLALSDIKARVAKGELQGDFTMQTETKNSPFSVQAHFARVQADELVTQAGGSKDTVRGVLEGALEATGELGDAEALTGTGTIELHGGHVQQFALLVAIGQVLQIEELTQLDLQQAEARYRLAGNSVLIDQLLLRSPNLRLNAAGTVALNGKLALDATLTINDKIRAQLFRAIRENFAATGQPGEYSLPFHIGGTLEKPKTDLMERAVGLDVKNIGGVIDALFGRGKGKKKKNVAPPQSSASPAATSVPSAMPQPTVFSPAPSLPPLTPPALDTSASTPAPAP